MAKATTQASFGPELFSFLADLRANNDRDWFAANRDRYEEQLLEPALEFINAFAPRLEKISPHFRADARPSGGSLFRIYRDTRFSKDKSPYKTNVGIHFRHERAKDAHAHSRGHRRRPRALEACHAHGRLREAARARRRLPQARSAVG
jgi:uncharacterized protein (TIGR02453 family)